MTSPSLKLTLTLSRKCWVCEQATLPAPNDRDHGDPSDPNRYKFCVACSDKVPFSIRRTKSYQRRWDEENAKNLYSEVMFLREQIQKHSPQS